MTKIFRFVFLFFILYSCSNENKSLQYYTFKKQITPSGKYVIYEYARNGEMSFGSSILGTKVFKIEDTFSEDKGIDINGYVDEWISDDTLLIRKNENNKNQIKDTLPIKVTYQNVGDFIIKYETYNAYSSGSAISLKFDSVYTTNDSIFIKLDTISLNIELSKYKIEKFRHQYNYLKNFKNKIFSSSLGNIYIRAKNDKIDEINVSTIFIKHLNADYKQNDGSTKYGLPGITNLSITFRPTKNISAEGINKRKIFWKEK